MKLDPENANAYKWSGIISRKVYQSLENSLIDKKFDIWMTAFSYLNRAFELKPLDHEVYYYLASLKYDLVVLPTPLRSSLQMTIDLPNVTIDDVIKEAELCEVLGSVPENLKLLNQAREYKKKDEE